jgi:shikimate dehydrogenase
MTSMPIDFDYAVIGNPIAHSKSPLIHALFARATTQDMRYGKLLAPLDGFAQTVTQFRAQGGRGCNVTVPFKLQAFEMASERSERAQLAQAANTLRFDGDGIYADNTDGVGLVRDITLNAQTTIQGQRVLLLGAGGAAAGALAPLIIAQPAQVVVCNRTLAKAQQLVQRRHAHLAQQHGVVLVALAAQDVESAFDLIINATASSLAGAAIPVDARVIAPDALVYDMMYGPSAQPMLDWARTHGAVGRDGLGMLIEQAAEAFAVWRGVRPDTAALMPQLRQDLL